MHLLVAGRCGGETIQGGGVLEAACPATRYWRLLHERLRVPVVVRLFAASAAAFAEDGDDDSQDCRRMQGNKSGFKEHTDKTVNIVNRV